MKIVKNVLILILVICGLSFVAVSASTTNENQNVAFNTKTYKVHKLNCEWAKRCTTNCIIIKRKDAYSKGGIPCKVCGG